MNISKLSLRIRIFLSMILLILLTSVLIVVVTVHQYTEQTDEYNKGRLQRKVRSVRASIDYWLENGNFFIISEKNLRPIFKDKINEISIIEKLELNIYNLKGKLEVSSANGFVKKEPSNQLSDSILTKIDKYPKGFMQTSSGQLDNLQSSFSYVKDSKSNPFGIVNIQYLQDNTAQEKDLEDFLYRLFFVYSAMFFITIAVAYFLSSYITKSIKEITNKIKQTKLNKRNEKIILKNESSEIRTLVTAYNSMVDELEKSVSKLAKSEREQAWREMAKQIAHEIKNPLTPMRLSTQNFQRKFDINDPEIYTKVNEFSHSLIQQIDSMSAIASAFSNFAKMPVQKNERLNVIEVVKYTTQIFSENYIHFSSKKEMIMVDWDKSQLIRIVTNLIKNSIQALKNKENKKIEVTVIDEPNTIVISVADNGKGISEEDKQKVFEPKFTTKSSGMGLGLAIVKNIVETYNGTVSFTSEVNVGTLFKIKIPKK